MKVNRRLLTGVFILPVYLISCYPDKKILARYSDGKPKAVRYYKHHDSLYERYVYYYDNGQKQYVRYWRNDLMQVYKMEAWYQNGAKREEGWMKEKDTVRKYSHSDSEYVFTGLQKEYARGWYENGRVKFEIITTKDQFLIVHYYDSTGMRTRQEFIKALRPDGYDTISFKQEMEPSGKRYYEDIKRNNMPSFLLDE